MVPEAEPPHPSDFPEVGIAFNSENRPLSAQSGYRRADCFAVEYNQKSTHQAQHGDML